jgi:hypothetical protein
MPRKPKAPKAPKEPDAPGAPPASTDTAAPEGILASLRNPAFRAWLKEGLTNAETVLKTGPNGNGWRFNESKRADAQAIHDGLAALLAE